MNSYRSSNRFSIYNKKGRRLIIQLWQAPSSVLIILVHGITNNRFSHGLFKIIAKFLQQKQYSVLSFDFSGHGESDDEIFSITSAVDDLTAVIEFAQQKKYKHIALLGHSFGALVCLKNYSSVISTMLFIGGLTGPVPWQWHDVCLPEHVSNIEKTGYAVVPLEVGSRKILKLDPELIHDLQSVNQQELFSSIQCPLLFVHGNQQEHERVLCDLSLQAQKHLKCYSQFHVLQNADHRFLSAIDHVKKHVHDWLSVYMPHQFKPKNNKTTYY